MALKTPGLTAWTSLPAMRYPSRYVWFVFFSSLDIILTWIILLANGSEVNPVANQVIQFWGLPGAVAFKFSLILFVIIICEVVGRKEDRRGSMLASFAVGVSAFPVAYSLTLMTIHELDFSAAPI